MMEIVKAAVSNFLDPMVQTSNYRFLTIRLFMLMVTGIYFVKNLLVFVFTKYYWTFNQKPHCHDYFAMFQPCYLRFLTH